MKLVIALIGLLLFFAFEGESLTVAKPSPTPQEKELAPEKPKDKNLSTKILTIVRIYEFPSTIKEAKEFAEKMTAFFQKEGAMSVKTWFITQPKITMIYYEYTVVKLPTPDPEDPLPDPIKPEPEEQNAPPSSNDYPQKWVVFYR